MISYSYEAGGGVGRSRGGSCLSTGAAAASGIHQGRTLCVEMRNAFRCRPITGGRGSSDNRSHQATMFDRPSRCLDDAPDFPASRTPSSWLCPAFCCGAEGISYSTESVHACVAASTAIANARMGACRMRQPGAACCGRRQSHVNFKSWRRAAWLLRQKPGRSQSHSGTGRLHVPGPACAWRSSSVC